MNKNILIILNAIVYNRGSEALVRGISKTIKEKNPDDHITLVSSEENFGSWINIENVDEYHKKINFKSKSIKRYIVAVLKRLKIFNNLINNLMYSNLKELAKKQDYILIVGADNYDITYGMQGQIKQLNTYLRKNTNAKIVLYDCSIAERDITKTLEEDLKNFDIVTVRETISKKNLEKIANKTKLFLYPDPAFTMDCEEIELPEIFKNAQVVGVNISNLITNPKYGSKVDAILKSYTNMMDYILENTDKNIMLIPHVMNNADLGTLRKLYEKYENNSRVYLVENESLNSKQLKYLISKCELFVGARTHATIAAYSTLVPTLVLGYSVKSKGIATDLFGTDEKYVLPVGDLKSEEYLTEGFKWLEGNKEDIKQTLENNMPNYIEKAKSIIEIIK